MRKDETPGSAAGDGGRMIQVSICGNARTPTFNPHVTRAWGIRTFSLETTTACSSAGANFAAMNFASDTFT
jgi:hypothetical protein